MLESLVSERSEHAIDDVIALARAEKNLGRVYLKQNILEKAELFMNSSINRFKDGNLLTLDAADTLIHLSEIYME